MGRVKYVLYDCDNTMGLSGKDIDDGLALLYLLGSPHIQLIGVTTTFGNASLSEVHDNTRRMFLDLGIEKIPLIRGAESAKNRRSEAAEYLAKTVKERTVPITILATGACTNLYGAYVIDHDFFLSAEEIVLMGGMTQPLYINGKKLDELNFSTDPEASYRVLSSGGQVSVITANFCTQALLEERRLKKIMEKNPHPVFRYIEKSALDWCRVFSNDFDVSGFYAWDIVAAV
jgi:inosine-uridine nucleoside N-ribohydrolase